MIASAPRVVHAVPGRIRVHAPGLSDRALSNVGAHVRLLPGVQRVSVNPLTSNLLVRFAPDVLSEQAILAGVRDYAPPDTIYEPGAAAQGPSAASPRRPPRRPLRLSIVQSRHHGVVRARIAVPGLDRNPRLARRVVETLQRHPGVRAHASALTGRVLVEFERHELDIEDLAAEIADVELPDVHDVLDEQPAHPLEPGPLIQSATRTAAAVTGLLTIGVRQLLGAPPRDTLGIARTNILFGTVSSFPFVRTGVRRLLGRDIGDLVLSLPIIVGLALSDNPIGLTLSVTESLRQLTEVLARRAAFRRYEARMRDLTPAQPGTILRLDTGDRTPLAATVVSGTASAIGPDGLPQPVAPGRVLAAGTRIFGGPCEVRLESGQGFTPQPRPAPARPSVYERYMRVVPAISLLYAGVRGLLMRSFADALDGLLLVSPRTALLGAEAASYGASARVLRAGVIVVGTRPERAVRRPHVLLLDGPHVLTDGFELAVTLPMAGGLDVTDVLERAAAVSVAAGSPWGGVFRAAGTTEVTDSSFDGQVARARVGGVEFTLGPAADDTSVRADIRLQQRGAYWLELRRAREAAPLGLLALRPRLAPGAAELVEVCRRSRVALALVSAGDPMAAQAVARRAAVPLLPDTDARTAIRARQAEGLLVAFASDSAGAAESFALCDLAIGISDGRSPFPARADLLAPDLRGVADVVDAGARRDLAITGAVALSAPANVGGAAFGLRGQVDLRQAFQVMYGTALGALVLDWLALRGGERRRSVFETLIEPRPEHWGQQSVQDVLRAFNTTDTGLSSADALARRQTAAAGARRHPLLEALFEQARSPLTLILAAGGALSLFSGGIANAAIIGATIAVNAVVGVWQEGRADQAARTLDQLGVESARVLRGGAVVQVPATELVPGDVLLLATGDRVAADARLISAQGLEVDEAALTGESLPVPKAPDGGTTSSRIVLDGSDVTSGTATAVAVAVGRHTRMGATAVAMDVDETEQSPLGRRLGRMLAAAIPLSLAAGAIVAGAGVLRGAAALPQLGLGVSISLAAVPEGLPLLARVGEATVARRLAARQALVRHLSAVEALGRVDVACADKTGTLTQGRLAVSLVADADEEAHLPGALSPALRDVLLCAALASPHPDAEDARSHPTDAAVIRSAEDAGLGVELRTGRTAESPFDPVRSFHSTVANDRLYLKGAPEVLIPRCAWVRRDGEDRPLDAASTEQLYARAEQLAERGLRVLLAASGAADQALDDPRDLTVLGFVGISDPLRAEVAAAVRRCREAGVRVIMLTGDHPATARTIAREAGMLEDGDGVLTGADLAAMHNGELDDQLERTRVIARATPLDKLRIIESLRRRGHIVAMTGDGVNDAPALRLADVGVAMGRAGTEVARQTADVVLVDDDFATLVETFVEGRSFWRNIRRSLGLLIGGNLGELGLIVGASLLGMGDPLNVRQILVVNMLTDILPTLAIALQRPESYNLAGLAREGVSALDRPLRNEIARRAATSAAPSLAAYLLALRAGGLPQASTVAFASIVTTQLAQTLDAGWTESHLNAAVVAASGGSLAILGAALVVPALRRFLVLELPTPFGWMLIGGGTVAALVLNRLLGLRAAARREPPAAPALSLP